MTVADREQDTVELPLVDLPIIWSYQRLGGVQLHSLAYPSQFRCAGCGAQREATLVAVDEAQSLLCPACIPARIRGVVGSAEPSWSGHVRAVCAAPGRRRGRQRGAGGATGLPGR